MTVGNLLLLPALLPSLTALQALPNIGPPFL